MIKKFCVFILVLFLLFKTPSYIQAAYVNLAWDPPVEGGRVEGYIVYWSITSGSYDVVDSMEVVGKTRATVSELDKSRNHYFIVKAYNDAGIGPASNEVFLEANSNYFHDDSSDDEVYDDEAYNDEAYNDSLDNEVYDNEVYDDSSDDEVYDDEAYNDSLDNEVYDNEVYDDSSDDEVSRKNENGGGCFIATAAIGSPF